jgi:hypothetical protein
MTETRQDLADRLDKLAIRHPRGDEMRTAATALRDATSGYFAEPQTVDVRRFMGTWARARRIWCECTGEPLA